MFYRGHAKCQLYTRGYLQYLDKLQERVDCTKARRKIHISVRPQIFIFLATTPTFARTQIFKFVSVTTLQTFGVLISNRRWRDTSSTRFWCLSDHSQALRDFGKGATGHDQTCPCVRWFRWRTFWELVMNFSLTNNTNSIVIELGTCIINLLF